MTAEEAVTAINRLVVATSNVTKQVNSTRGAGKTALAEERKAASVLFKTITGAKPTDEQVKEMTY